MKGGLLIVFLLSAIITDPAKIGQINRAKEEAKKAYLAGDYEKGVDNMCRAYVMYQDTNSPKKIEAQKNLAFYLDDLKEKGKFEIFKKAATNNGIILE